METRIDLNREYARTMDDCTNAWWEYQATHDRQAWGRYVKALWLCNQIIHKLSILKG